MWDIYIHIIVFINFQCTFACMFYVHHYLVPLFICIYVYSFIYLSIHWKSGTSDPMVLMLFVLQCTDYKYNFLTQGDVIKWKHFPRYWPFLRGIHRSPVNSRHNGQWRGALMFSLICVWINGWVNNREAGDLRRHRAHYDVTVMSYSGTQSRMQSGTQSHHTQGRGLINKQSHPVYACRLVSAHSPACLIFTEAS